jgi:HD-GYP domain-containing protein (c-di-GMP phosphodiesterase class II)
MILMSLRDVRPGMLVGIGLRNKEGHVLLGPGVALTAEYISRLEHLGYCAIWVDDEDTRDIPYADTLSEATRLAATDAVQDTFMLTSREADKLRTVSVDEVRGMLESRGFRQAFENSSAIERLTDQVDAVVGEVLDRAVLTGLGSLRTHNTYTYQHCLDVAVTAAMLGRLVGYDRETLKRLAVGCILHDIGILFATTALTERPGALAGEEEDRVKDHTVLGYLFIRDSLKLGALPAHIAYQHHERQDGQGYPRGLTGRNKLARGSEVHVPGRIEPLAEIAAVADLHDTLSADRPWRRRLPPDQVWQAIAQAAGHHLNREIVDSFLAVLPPYPLGTQVMVTEGRWNGHCGVVARVPHHRMDAPVIRLLTAPDGHRIEPVELDLSREGVRIRGVLSAMDGGLEPQPEPGTPARA